MAMAENRTYSEDNRPLISKRSRAVTFKKDRISSLPDSLLIHILSFLDTKEAVGTCLLSKRWEFVWADLSEVNLDGYSSNSAKTRRFVDWVGRMFVMCRNLNKFHVSFCYEKCFASNVNNWVYFAIKSKVKDISLSIFREYELPQMFYSYSSLTNLTLDYCVIAPRRVIAWGSLKSLCLKDLKLLDSVMHKILAGCPLLNFLHLVKCWELKFLNIYSPNLTTLELSDYYSLEGEVVPAISAPYLRFLSIINVHGTENIRLSNVSSVVQANLDSINGDDDMHQMLHNLKSLQSVENLELGRHCFKMVSLLEGRGYKLPLFTQLQCLTLVVWRHEISIPGILGLLRSSPKLETLHIIGCWDIGDEFGFNELSELDNQGIYLNNCNMDLVASHLKTVKITDFSEEDLADEYMLALMETLLKSAKVLEKMIISVKKYPIAKKRLLTFVRASPEATVVFC